MGHGMVSIVSVLGQSLIGSVALSDVRIYDRALGTQMFAMSIMVSFGLTAIGCGVFLIRQILLEILDELKSREK